MNSRILPGAAVAILLTALMGCSGNTTDGPATTTRSNTNTGPVVSGNPDGTTVRSSTVMLPDASGHWVKMQYIPGTTANIDTVIATDTSGHTTKERFIRGHFEALSLDGNVAGYNTYVFYLMSRSRSDAKEQNDRYAALSPEGIDPPRFVDSAYQKALDDWDATHTPKVDARFDFIPIKTDLIGRLGYYKRHGTNDIILLDVQ